MSPTRKAMAPPENSHHSPIEDIPGKRLTPGDEPTRHWIGDIPFCHFIFLKILKHLWLSENSLHKNLLLRGKRCRDTEKSVDLQGRVIAGEFSAVGREAHSKEFGDDSKINSAQPFRTKR